MVYGVRALGFAVAISLLSTSALATDSAEDEGAIRPIPQTVKVNEEKAALGEKLYNDTMLSADGSVSCASCHALSKGGTDQLPVSTGIKSQQGPINSPTVFNSEHNFVQFWDGRAANLAEQALGPVENPKEMGEKWDAVIAKLKQNPEYVTAFAKLHGDKEITKEAVADAIAEFEKTLITPDSPFDEYLRGNKEALSEEAKRGYALFEEKGCVSCHNGTYLGGNSYQYMSEEYFEERGGEVAEADLGRYNVTKDEADKHAFKVPMLRNVAVTGPYFHDGQVKTLEEAVTLMAKHQLGDELAADEVKALVAFLQSLTGKYKGISLDTLTEEAATAAPSEKNAEVEKSFFDALMEWWQSE